MAVPIIDLRSMHDQEDFCNKHLTLSPLSEFGMCYNPSEFLLVVWMWEWERPKKMAGRGMYTTRHSVEEGMKEEPPHVLTWRMLPSWPRCGLTLVEEVGKVAERYQTPLKTPSHVHHLLVHNQSTPNCNCPPPSSPKCRIPELFL